MSLVQQHGALISFVCDRQTVQQEGFSSVLLDFAVDVLSSECHT